MSEKLLVPDIGDFDKVEVIEILVKQGDQLNTNDPVITIESDKSSVEIPSTVSGKIELVAVKVGDKVSKGDLILSISSSGKNKKSVPIPKDTESIIKEAEGVLKNEKLETVQKSSIIIFLSEILNSIFKEETIVNKDLFNFLLKVYGTNDIEGVS